MKVKLLGLTVFEIQRDFSEVAPPRRLPANATPAKPPPRAQAACAPPRPWAALHQSADILPRTKRGTIDAETSLRLWGITDPKLLWQHRFKPGTAGTALKCILGARAQKLEPPASDGLASDLAACPSEPLPRVPGTGKLDLDACLARFGIEDPSILWEKRYRPNSVGGRLKLGLRARGFTPISAGSGPRAAKLRTGEPPLTSPVDAAPTAPAQEQSSHPAAQGSPQGTTDIQAALAALGITEPKSLWQNPVEPGSAQHELKKAIARALARREPVPGITRLDIGLTP